MENATINELEPIEQYRRILRKLHWRALPADVMIKCYNAIVSLDALPRSEIISMAVMKTGGQLTATDARKVSIILTKSGLMRISGSSEDGDKLWQVAPVTESDMLWIVDRAMTVRLLSGIDEAGIKLDKKILPSLLLSEQNKADVDSLLGFLKIKCSSQQQI